MGTITSTRQTRFRNSTGEALPSMGKVPRLVSHTGPLGNPPNAVNRHGTPLVSSTQGLPSLRSQNPTSLRRQRRPPLPGAYLCFGIVSSPWFQLRCLCVVSTWGSEYSLSGFEIPSEHLLAISPLSIITVDTCGMPLVKRHAREQRRPLPLRLPMGGLSQI